MRDGALRVGHFVCDDHHPLSSPLAVAYPQLKAAIEAELEKVDMRHDDDATFQLQVDKSIQLYESESRGELVVGYPNALTLSYTLPQSCSHATRR